MMASLTYGERRALSDPARVTFVVDQDEIVEKTGPMTFKKNIYSAVYVSILLQIY